jgi:hypothetical protein
VRAGRAGEEGPDLVGECKDTVPGHVMKELHSALDLSPGESGQRVSCEEEEEEEASCMYLRSPVNSSHGVLQEVVTVPRCRGVDMNFKSLSVVEAEEILRHVDRRLGLDVGGHVPHLDAEGVRVLLHGLPIHRRLVSEDEIDGLLHQRLLSSSVGPCDLEFELWRDVVA